MGWPDGVDRIVLDRVDSTMAEASRRAQAGSGPVWVLAREQTAGRGRRGRVWAHPPGNFAATLLMTPSGGPEYAALRSFVMALALHDALAGLIGSAAGLALKWPNDVLLSGGKMAGILLETVGAAGGQLAIGVGVNLIAAPPADGVEPGAVRPVSVLAETGQRVAPEAMLDALAPAFAGWERQLRAYGFGPVRDAWLTRAARLGETVTARMARRSLTGTFETVDETGAIVLKTPDGRRAIAAAEIFF